MLRPIRSALFVPADSERKLEKAMASGADALFIDLEDSVAPTGKAVARSIATQTLHQAKRDATGPQLWVRINALDTPWAQTDLEAVMQGGPEGIVLPKCEHAHDIERLATHLRAAEAVAGIADGSTRIIAIITETARALLNVASYASAPDPRLAALTWGAEDLASDLGVLRKRDSSGGYTDMFRLARTQTLLAAGAAGVQALDTVFPNFRDVEAFAAECDDAAADGFSGKMAIHPAQVEPINRAMTPGVEAVARARAIVEAFEAAPDSGVLTVDGAMVDRPHLALARRTLARSRD